MRFIGILGEDETVPCASCHQAWSVRYLMQALGRPRLRQEGFAFVWFDDGIMVNWCPSCEMPTTVPAMVRVQMPAEVQHLFVAA